MTRKIKIFLCIFVSLIGLALLCISIRELAEESASTAELTWIHRIERSLPKGSSKARVQDWLSDQSFTFMQLNNEELGDWIGGISIVELVGLNRCESIRCLRGRKNFSRLLGLGASHRVSLYFFFNDDGELTKYFVYIWAP